MRSVTLPKLPLLWPTFATPLLTQLLCLTHWVEPAEASCCFQSRMNTGVGAVIQPLTQSSKRKCGLRVRHPACDREDSGRETATPRPRFKNRTWAPGSRQKLDYWAAAFGLKKLLASTSCLGVIRRPRDLRRLEARPSPVALAREYHAYAAT